MSIQGLSFATQNPAIVPPMDLKAALEAQKARGGVSILTPPSPADTDPDAPFLREGKAPGIWVIVQIGTPISAPAVKADFGADMPEPIRQTTKAPMDPPTEPETTPEAAILRRAEIAAEADARGEVSTDPVSEPKMAQADMAADEADQEAFDKIVDALKVIRGGEPMPWDGALATV